MAQLVSNCRLSGWRDDVSSSLYVTAYGCDAKVDVVILSACLRGIISLETLKLNLHLALALSCGILFKSCYFYTMKPQAHVGAKKIS